MNRPWVAHYDPHVDPDPLIPDISLPELFDRTALRFPSRTATIFHDARLTYAQLKNRIDAFAASLLDSGVHPGDRIAVMLPNIPQFLIAFFGALRAGAVVVPTNPLYTSHELEHQLADSGTSVIVTLDQFFPTVQTALSATDVRCVILTNIGAALPHHLRFLHSVQQRRQGVHSVHPGGIVRRMEPLYAAPPRTIPLPVSPEHLAVLQYTGGTTGTSKGAMLSHRNLVANAVQAAAWQGVTEEEEGVLCVTPFFHVYGLTIGMNLAVVAGGTMLLLPRWSPAEAAAVSEKYAPQYFPGVPTMYVALSHLPGASPRQFASLRACISGSAPLPTRVQRDFYERCGARIVEGYGLTEAAPVTHCNPVQGDNRPGTVGVPFPGTDATVTDPDTWEPVETGAVGEITVRGPQVMMGYWNRPAETAQVLRDGWLHTGDLGTMDEDGYFRIVDRKKDVIIAGGFNVYPREVEEVLYTHHTVAEAVVLGVPDEYRGETVKAVLVLKPGTTTSVSEVEAYCRRHLAAYKIPRIIEFRDSLPKTVIGKVLRRELRVEAGIQPVGEPTG